MKPPKIAKVVLGIDREERRVSIPSTTKNRVYEGAKRRCESCGMPLKMADRGAQFHHLRKPTAKSRASTIQFLCATCHRRYGHRKKTTTKHDLLSRPYQVTKIDRLKVRKHKSPYWEQKPKKTALRKKKPSRSKTA